MLKEIKKTVQLLKSQDIPYVLIGGYAVAIYGYPRATVDADFLVDVKRESYPELKKAFGQKKARVKISFSAFDDPVGDVFHVMIGNARIQLIVVKRVWEREAVEQYKLQKINNFRIRVPRLEYLILLKEKAGGIKDRLDVENLLDVNKTTLNKSLLARLRKKYLKP